MSPWWKYEPSAKEKERAERQRQREHEERHRAQFDEYGRAVRRVVVTDFDMPFWSITSLLVKIAFAAIPALFVIGLALWALDFVFSHGHPRLPR